MNELTISIDKLSQIHRILNNTEKIISDIVGMNIKIIMDFNSHKKLTTDIIIDVVSKVTGVLPENITSKSRIKETVEARRLAMRLCYDYLPVKSQSSLGQVFSNRDHSTISYSMEQFKEQCETDKNFYNLYMLCRDALQNEIEKMLIK